MPVTLLAMTRCMSRVTMMTVTDRDCVTTQCQIAYFSPNILHIFDVWLCSQPHLHMGELPGASLQPLSAALTGHTQVQTPWPNSQQKQPETDYNACYRGKKDRVKTNEQIYLQQHMQDIRYFGAKPLPPCKLTFHSLRSIDDTMQVILSCSVPYFQLLTSIQRVRKVFGPHVSHLRKLAFRGSYGFDYNVDIIM